MRHLFKTFLSSVYSQDDKHKSGVLNEEKGNYMGKQIWPSTGMDGKGQTRMNNTSDVQLSDPALEVLF